MSPLLLRCAAKALLATVLGFAAHGALAAQPTGTWATEDGRARIRTELCGAKVDRLCGYIVWLTDPRDKNGQLLLDTENPDPEKRKRPILGHQMLLGLKVDEDGRYDGKVYNADNGKSYDIHVWSEKPEELSVKGCMLAVLCSSQLWTRVTDEAPGQLQGPTNGPGGPRSDHEWAPRPEPAGGSQKPHTTGAPAP